MSLKRIFRPVILTLFLVALYQPFLPSPITSSYSLQLAAAPSINRTWQTLSLLYPGQFHDTVMLQEEINQFHTQVPELVDLEVIGQTFEGRDITCLRITNELVTEQKAKTLVVAYHHGREQITIEMALRFILRLLNNYGIDPVMTNYIDTEEIYIIPSLNLDALDVVVNQGNHWLRKNLRPFDNDGDGLFDEDSAEDDNGDGHISEFDVFSKVGGSLYYEYSYYEGIDNDGDGQTNEDEVGLVDLNRNYPTGWGNPGSSADPISQVYHGSAPFSEPETDCFRTFVLSHRFGMAYSLHSGINATYFPSDTSGSWKNPLLYTQMRSDLNALLPPGFNSFSQMTNNLNKINNDAKSLEAGEFGLWQDWMYASRNTPVPICFEVYHNGSVDGDYTIVIDNPSTLITEWKGIYGYFNPVAAYIDDLWQDVQPAFDYLLQMTPRLAVNLLASTPLGNGLKVDVSMHCLSPRISTVESIDVLDGVGTLLQSALPISAGAVVTTSFSLPADALNTPQVVRIGNNYTGYIRFQVVGVTGLSPLLIGAAILVGVVALVIVIYLVKRSRN